MKYNFSNPADIYLDRFTPIDLSEVEIVFKSSTCLLDTIPARLTMFSNRLPQSGWNSEITELLKKFLLNLASLANYRSLN